MKINLKRKKDKSIFPSAYRGTVLSDASLGIDDVPVEEIERKTHNTYGYFVYKGKKIYKKRWVRKTKSYPELLVEPPSIPKWYPSHSATFKFSKKLDPMWAMGIISDKYNPSWWKDRKGYTTLRVAYNYKFFIKSLLKKYGLWYNRSINVWKKRWNFENYQE